MTDVYETLQSFSDFQGFAECRNYARVPPSWSVIVAHIVGASIAIHNGPYRDVNTVGGACIATVKNAIKDTTTDFPYVFGGDTTIIVLPESCYHEALCSLLALRRIVAIQFNSTLNVQSLTVKKIERLSQKTVEVARFEIHTGMCIALFRGGGIAYAVNRLKGNVMDSLSEKGGAKALKASLEGLSCRWNKIPAKNVCIVTLLVYDYWFMITLNPANVDIAHYKGLGQLLREECCFHQSACSCAFVARAFEIILCVIIFKLGLLKSLVFDSRSYKASTKNHADYCKFDDMLRMVLDCTKDQANAIEFMLHDKHYHGQKLFHGVFYSSHSLMNCLVDDVVTGNHIHFMDGDNGGYAMAAKQMKAQMEETKQEKHRKFVVHDLLRAKILMEDSSKASFSEYNLSTEDIGQSTSDIEEGLGARTSHLLPERQIFSSFASLSSNSLQFASPNDPKTTQSTDSIDTYSVEATDPEHIDLSFIDVPTKSIKTSNHQIMGLPERVIEEEEREDLVQTHGTDSMAALEGGYAGIRIDLLNGPNAFLKSINRRNKKSKKKSKKMKNNKKSPSSTIITRPARPNIMASKRLSEVATPSRKLSKERTVGIPTLVTVSHEQYHDESNWTDATCDTSGGRYLGHHPASPLGLLQPDWSQNFLS